jgi:hypothetical protein
MRLSWAPTEVGAQLVMTGVVVIAGELSRWSTTPATQYG